MAERGVRGVARSPTQWSGEKYLKRSDQNSQQPTTNHPSSRQQLSSVSRSDTSAKTISVHLGTSILQTISLLWVHDVCCVLDQNKSRLSVSRLILNSYSCIRSASDSQLRSISWSTNIFLFLKELIWCIFSIKNLFFPVSLFLPPSHYLSCVGSITSALSFPRIGSQKCNKTNNDGVKSFMYHPFQFIKRSVTLFGEGLYLECPNKLSEHPAMDKYKAKY